MWISPAPPSIDTPERNPPILRDPRVTEPVRDAAGEIAVEIDVEIHLHRRIRELCADRMDRVFVDARVPQRDGSIFSVGL